MKVIRTFIFTFLSVVSFSCYFFLLSPNSFLKTIDQKSLAVMKLDVIEQDSPFSLAQKLYEEGILHDPVPFYVGAQILFLFKPLKPGKYPLHLNEKVIDIFKRLFFHKRNTYSLNIPEGWTVFQIIEKLNSLESLEGGVTVIPMEGSLFPATYNYFEGESRDNLLKRMVQKMDEVKHKEWIARAHSLPYENVDQALVMASIIEKESAHHSEKTEIAAVFINRLNQGTKLQADPTVVYGLTFGRHRLERELYRSDWKAHSLHNTYTIAGLPPTPICCPGRESIRAALRPKKTNSLFFVANGEGGHHFSEKLADHNNKVRQWQSIKGKKKLTARKLAH